MSVRHLFVFIFTSSNEVKVGNELIILTFSLVIILALPLDKKDH